MIVERELELLRDALVKGRSLGAGKTFWRALATNEAAFNAALAAVKPFTEEDAGSKLVTVAVNPSAPLRLDRSKPQWNWRIATDGNSQSGMLNIGLMSPFEKEEGLLNGPQLLERSHWVAASLSQRSGEALFAQFQMEPAPTEWHDTVIAFTETIWQDRQDRLYVLCMDFIRTRPRLSFHSLEMPFGKRTCLPFRLPPLPRVVNVTQN